MAEKKLFLSIPTLSTELFTMSFASCFDLFTDCYVYGCITLIVCLIISELAYFLLSLIGEQTQHHKVLQTDFYSQVKELLNEDTKAPLANFQQPEDSLISSTATAIFS